MQVPFISWTGDIPLAGWFAERAVAAAARPFSSLFMGTTGTQFFLQDAEEGRAPLLVRRAFLHICCGHLQTLLGFQITIKAGNAGEDDPR